MKNEKYQNESCMEIVPVEIQKKADGSQDETFQEGKKTKDEGGGTAVEAKEDDGASFAEKFANFF